MMSSANHVSIGKYLKRNKDSNLYEVIMLKSRRKSGPKNKFNENEDKILKEAVYQFGTTDWNKISKLIPGKNARQCRERWNNYANPQISTKPWTKEEDELLELKYAEYGPKWQIIAAFFANRPVNTIKNRWLVKVKKSKRIAERGNSSTAFVQPDPPSPYPSIDNILTSLPIQTKLLPFPDIPLF